MLDFSTPNIQKLISNRHWKGVEVYNRIKQIYNFVRDEILFAYNVDDSIPASRVLAEGCRQCNTKGTLFMALLRGVDVPCRMHGFTIDKKLQKGTMTGIVYKKAPKNIFHSWVEVYLDGVWYELEAFILDKKYLSQIQNINSTRKGTFWGYGVAVKDLRNPVIDFSINNTYIQSEGINHDFGIYECPDDLLQEHHQEISIFEAFLYRNLGRHLMNYNIKKIRNAKR
ncbi:transglutaminase-like domain-containing protein [Blautia hydrogenotrophica]|uniref:transglutaminase-like domain-containing protein n=1 Tax=Blautia hydrogenotrophica TaxID=53443 RepID=UPI002E764F7E|nr:transglutaminase-like domain-containing protein [Blautia hydrogenotrophica]MEE0461949.1 transglutaminase-like domain-containing protein [Blautia hydrogenotrophica]